MSADPALGEYMAGSAVGEGGIYNQVNFNLYHYAGNNPIKYVDPDGRELYVSGTEEYITQVTDCLKEICPSATVDKKSGKVTNDKNENSIYI